MDMTQIIAEEKEKMKAEYIRRAIRKRLDGIVNIKAAIRRYKKEEEKQQVELSEELDKAQKALIDFTPEDTDLFD